MNGDDTACPIHAEREDEVFRIFRTNALSPLGFAAHFTDRLAPGGRIAFMSSGLGSVSRNSGGGYEASRASKTALNTFARSFAARHRDIGALVVDPGRVRTDMDGPRAPLDAPTSAAGIADMFAARAGAKRAVFVDWENNEVPW